MPIPIHEVFEAMQEDICRLMRNDIEFGRTVLEENREKPYISSPKTLDQSLPMNLQHFKYTTDAYKKVIELQQTPSEELFKEYIVRTQHIPLPNNEQIQRFSQWIGDAHSWYKGPPPLFSFVFFLSDNPGEADSMHFRPYKKGDELHSEMTIEEAIHKYTEKFGFIDYCKLMDLGFLKKNKDVYIAHVSADEIILKDAIIDFDSREYDDTKIITMPNELISIAKRHRPSSVSSNAVADQLHEMRSMMYAGRKKYAPETVKSLFSY